MNKVKQFLDNQSLPRQVYQLLDIDPQFEHMVIAGGSIANALLYLYTGRCVVFNDIDMFQIKRERPSLHTQNEKDNLLISGDERVYNKQHDYPASFTDGRCTYYMTDRDKIDERYDLITYTGRSFMTDMTNIDMAKVTINGFDLNCCQAALVDGVLVYTPAFVKFLDTLQIEIVNLQTIKTFVRAIVKAKELGVYFNMPQAYEFALIYLAIYYPNLSSLENQRGETPQQLLASTIDTVKFDDPVKQKELERLRTAYDFSVFERVKNLTTHQGVFESGGMPVVSEDTQLFHSYASQVHNSHGSGLFNPLYQIAGLSKHNKTLLKRLPVYARIFPMIHGNVKEYLSGVVPVSLFDEWGELLFEHSGMKQVFNGLTLSEQLTLYQNIKSAINKYGIEVIGLIESDSRMVLRTVLTARFWNEIKALTIDQNELLVRELLPNVTASTAVIKELVTKKQLADEGKKQHHCVGGYWQSVGKGKSRIVSIRDKAHMGNEVSTAELRLDKYHGLDAMVSAYPNPVKIVQHRASLNRDPSERHKEILKAYVKILNDKPVYERVGWFDHLVGIEHGENGERVLVNHVDGLEPRFMNPQERIPVPLDPNRPRRNWLELPDAIDYNLFEV